MPKETTNIKYLHTQNTRLSPAAQSVQPSIF